jgi:hypothetical protein
MRLLCVDVTGQGIQIRRTNGKRAIASLPRELRQGRRLGLQPFGRGRFEFFHQFRNIHRAGQTNSEVNVVRDTSNPITFAFGVAGDRSKIGVERGTYGSIEDGHAVFCAEDYMDQNKRERLWHRENYRSGFQPSFIAGICTWGVAPGWYRAAPLALSRRGASIKVAVALFIFALTPAFAKTQPHTVRIRIINAQTNKPVTDENLNVALRVDQIGSVAMKTDKDGIINVDTGHATIIRILSNMYADCRSRGELYTNYSIAEIHANGITTGNLCSNARPKAKPGELILFEIPKTYIPTMSPTTPAPKEKP